MCSKYLLFFILIHGILVSCQNKKESITPEIKNITESVYASGTVRSNNQYEVFSLTNGILIHQFVKEGMYVKKGAPLLQLDNRTSKFSTNNAQLAVETNNTLATKEKLQDANNTIQIAYKRLLNDSLLYTKQKNLWRNEIGTQVELEQRKLNFENSKVAHAHAKLAYEDIKRQVNLSSKQSKNNLQIAKTLEDDYILRSQMDGVVYKINKEEGDLITNNSPIAIIGSDAFILSLDIDEIDIVKIKPNQQVLIRMDSYSTQVFEGKILTIYPLMNERTRTFKVEGIFTKQPETLYPNLSLEANIIIQSKKNALTIPRNYLLNDTSVLLENGTKQKINIGLMDYNLVEITGGLSSTSKIIRPKNEN